MTNNSFSSIPYIKRPHLIHNPSLPPLIQIITLFRVRICWSGWSHVVYAKITDLRFVSEFNLNLKLLTVVSVPFLSGNFCFYWVTWEIVTKSKYREEMEKCIISIFETWLTVKWVIILKRGFVPARWWILLCLEMKLFFHSWKRVSEAI